MKQVMVVRTDLKMSKGKMAVQSCHASLGAFKKADGEKTRKWESEGEKKVLVKAKDLRELYEIYEIVKNTDIPVYLVHDAGRTELPKGTVTCLGIGPDEDEKIDKITNELKLL